MSVTTTSNSRVIEIGEKIGHVKNNWRLRNVSIYEIIGDPENVCTVAAGFTCGRDTGSDCIAVEPRADWQRYIGTFNGIIN